MGHSIPPPTLRSSIEQLQAYSPRRPFRPVQFGGPLPKVSVCSTVLPSFPACSGLSLSRSPVVSGPMPVHAVHSGESGCSIFPIHQGPLVFRATGCGRVRTMGFPRVTPAPADRRRRHRLAGTKSSAQQAITKPVQPQCGSITKDSAPLLLSQQTQSGDQLAPSVKTTNWAITGNGFYGGAGFRPEHAGTLGQPGIRPRADLATREEHDHIASGTQAARQARGAATVVLVRPGPSEPNARNPRTGGRRPVGTGAGSAGWPPNPGVTTKTLAG